MENENTETEVKTEKTSKPKKAKAPKAPKEPKAKKEPKVKLPREIKARPTTALTHAAAVVFSDFQTLSLKERAAFIENAREYERVEGVKASRAITKVFDVGTRVSIVGGNAKLIGSTGTITEARRVRVFVELDGTDGKVAYLFASDCAPIEQLETETEEASEAIAV